jgi:hypothetical protein
MKKLGLLIALFVLVSASLPAWAQDPTPVAEGLNSPRGLAYDENGVLFVAQSGIGGPIETNGPFGPATLGYSSQISTVLDGQTQTLIGGLPSLEAQPSELLGAISVALDSNTLWVVMGHEIVNVPFSATIVGFDRITLRPQHVIDLYAYEQANNPDGKEVLSNPNDIAIAEDGTLYIVDASGNAVYTWTIEAGLQVWKSWDTNPVPTSVAIGADGSIFIGFLTGFPFPAEGATIDQYNPDGTLVTTYAGLTAVTDIIWHDGTLFAVQIASGFGETGWIPDSGSIVAVTPDGLFPVAEGLNFPYALAATPDGTQLAVSVNSSYSEAGSGAVWLVSATPQ